MSGLLDCLEKKLMKRIFNLIFLMRLHVHVIIPCKSGRNCEAQIQVADINFYFVIVGGRVTKGTNKTKSMFFSVNSTVCRQLSQLILFKSLLDNQCC